MRTRVLVRTVRERGARSGCRRPLALALAALLMLACAGCARERGKYPEASARDGVVPIDVGGIDAGSGRFFTYRAGNGRLVDFFVYRESSGVPHAVLDACRTCYRWKKGYALDGGEVVCIKCDMRFKLDGLAEGSGSCVPIPLNAERRGERLIIPASELEGGARYF